MEKIQVLIVDDEADFQKMLIKRLGKRGIEARGALSGEEALESLKNHVPEVIVLDAKMPGMDGIDTLKAIKEKYPKVEVIMLTGHASMEAANQGMELGAFDYLMKPAKLDELVYKIQDAHKKRKLSG